MPQQAVAIVGGGLCGSAAVESLLASGVEVTLLDMGRRGLGGRASVRHSWILEGGGEASAPQGTHPDRASAPQGALHAMAFEHGCQFLAVRPDEGHPSRRAFRKALERAGAQPWPGGGPGRLGWLAEGAFLPQGDQRAEGLGPGLFGACSADLELYAVPELCAKLVAEAGEQYPGLLHVMSGARVTGLMRTESGGWQLCADGLDHEKSAQDLSSSAGTRIRQLFDAVVFTDHMAFLPDWHPLHIHGLHEVAPRLVATVRSALGWDEGTRRFHRIASLFTCMLAFAPGRGTEDALPFDAACIDGNAVLQWICCQRSKLLEGTAEPEAECWVLLSTEAFAKSCLRGEAMSALGEGNTICYRPQTDDYLKGDPAREMVRAFNAAVGPLLPDSQLDSPLFARCQRWGAAYPLEREPELTAPFYSACEYDGEAATGLFAAGDWACPAPPLHAQAAFESGRAVAAAVAAGTSAGPTRS